jgi:hypothetical protein
LLAGAAECADTLTLRGFLLLSLAPTEVAVRVSSAATRVIVDVKPRYAVLSMGRFPQKTGT